MAGRGRGRGGLGQEVLACLAAADGPLTPAQVLSDLGGGLAYTTVLTALSRLRAKGALVRFPAGRAFAYALATDPRSVGAAVTARRMRRLLVAGEDRAGVLTHFVADLSPDEEALLAEVLDDARQDARPDAHESSRRDVDRDPT